MSISLADLVIAALLFGAFGLSPIYPFVLFLKGTPAYQKKARTKSAAPEQKVPLIDDAPSIVAGWHRRLSEPSN